MSTEMKPQAEETPTATAEEQHKPTKRGFAALPASRLSELARMGGKAAHAAGTAHKFTSDEARVAGSKGGHATHAKRKTELP
jgi:general stress protein YciG